MSFTSKEMIDTLVDATLGKKNRHQSSEALEHRKKLDAQVAEIEKKGGVVQIPHEWPDITEDEPAHNKRQKDEEDYEEETEEKDDFNEDTGKWKKGTWNGGPGSGPHPGEKRVVPIRGSYNYKTFEYETRHTPMTKEDVKAKISEAKLNYSSRFVERGNTKGSSALEAKGKISDWQQHLKSFSSYPEHKEESMDTTTQNHGTPEGYAKGRKKVTAKKSLANKYADLETSRAEAASRLADANADNATLAFFAHKQHNSAASSHKEAGNDGSYTHHKDQASKYLKKHTDLNEEQEAAEQKKDEAEAVQKAGKDVTKPTSNVNLNKRAGYLEQKYGEKIYDRLMKLPSSRTIVVNGKTRVASPKYSSGQVQAAVISILRQQAEGEGMIGLLKKKYQFSDESARLLYNLTQEICFGE